MPKVIVAEFISLDGVVEDPDGAEGSAAGGWAFRYGPQAVAGDKFGFREVLDTGVLALGRRTWQRFSQLWPRRSDTFSAKMNAIEKLVASRTLTEVGGWRNSTLLAGDVVQEVSRRRARQDVIVVGSLSVAQLFMGRDLVDEYRLLVFPVVLGQGRRLFGTESRPVHLVRTGAQAEGAATLLTFSREPRGPAAHGG